MACGRLVSLSECSHGDDGGLGSAPVTSLGMWMVAGRRQGSAIAPSCPASPTNPRGSTGHGEFLRFTLLWYHAVSTQPGHRAHADDPSPAQVGFGPGFQERVAAPVWVSLSGLLSWCLCAMLRTASCSECSSIQHPHPTLTVSSSFPLRRELQWQRSRAVCAAC